MARTTLTVQYSPLNDVSYQGAATTGFLNQVNAALALLVNPTIRQWSVQALFVQKRMSLEWLFFCEYDTGGAALATPFTLRIDQSSGQNTLAALTASVNTFLSTYTGFSSGGRLQRLDSDTQIALKQFAEFRLLNATSGASANYLPL